MVCMWGQTNGYTIEEVGEDISSCYKEESLVMVNHQSTADVPLLFACLTDKADGYVIQNVMWIMDKFFMYLNFGWVSVVHGDFFIKQGKEMRENQLQMLSEHLENVYKPRNRKWIVVFPEGGFLRKRKLTSQKFAKKKDLPHLENVTLPRVGCFSTTLDHLNPQLNHNKNLLAKGEGETSKGNVQAAHEIKWIIDITVGYPDGGKPLDLVTLSLGQRPPCKTTVYYRRYPVHDIPRDTDGLTNWMYDRFIEKEKLLSHYYKNGVFPSLPSPHSRLMDLPHIVHFSYRLLFTLHLFFILSTYFHYLMLRWLSSQACGLVWA